MAIPTEEARKALIEAARQAAEAAGSDERARIAWKTSGYHTSVVVEVPVDSVLLNPNSHRIRAQLESHPNGDLIKTQPYSEEAQALIADLLRQTDGFERLKENLKEVGQRDYGITTHTGLLVNANTRCVALRDLEVSHLRVAILPPDAQQRDIDHLELRLQLQQDFKQEYSFSNALLFVDDMLNLYGYTPEKVALEMHLAAKSDPPNKRAEETQRHVRMLATTRELQHLSGGKLPLTWFDDKEQAMQELDTEVEKLKKQDPEAARKLKNNRLLGMVANVGYRELREMDDDFVDQYLVSTMDEQPLFEGRVDEVLASPEPEEAPDIKGLEVFDAVTPVPSAGPDVEGLLTRLAASHGQAKVALVEGQGGGVEEERGDVLYQLGQAINDAANEAKDERKLGNLHDQPRKLLSAAAKTVRKATDAYRQVRGRSEFKSDPFKAARTDLDGALAALDKALGETN